MNARYNYLLFFFLLFEVSTYAVIGSRGLVIVSEYGENENVAVTLDQDPSIPLTLGQGKPAGIGAAAKLLLTALYQGVPALAPAPLWDTIVEHKKIFDTVTKDIHRLHQLYGSSKRFGQQGELEDFRERSLFIKRRYERIKQGLSTGSARNALTEIVERDSLFNYVSVPDSIKKMDAIAWNEILSYLMCSMVPVDHYTVREITLPHEPGLPFYLFIPKALFFSHLHDRQRGLGLKVDQYTPVNNLFTSKTYADGASLKYPHLLEDVLKAVFVSKAETTRVSMPAEQWSIFLMGHGHFCHEDERAIRVAGMSLEHFKRVLLCLEHAIDTRLLFYVSCSAGGKNFIDAFTQDGQSMQLSYTVFAYALTEAASFVASPVIRLDFFNDDKVDSHLAKLIDWNKNRIMVDAPYNFSTFFELSQDVSCASQTIHELIRSLNPSHRISYNGLSLAGACRLSSHEVNNATSVRLPKSSSFRVINDIETFVPLSSTPPGGVISTYTIPESKELVLLCDSDIPYTVKMVHNTTVTPLPSFVSLVPGKAAHTISKLDAPNATFSALVKNFFVCEKLLVPKLFHIKRLSCAQDEVHHVSVEFSDVLLFNYVPAYLVNSSYMQDVPSCEFYNGVIARRGGQIFMSLWCSSESAPSLIEQQLKRVPSGLFSEALHSFFNTVPYYRQGTYCSPLISVDELSSFLRAYYQGRIE